MNPEQSSYGWRIALTGLSISVLLLLFICRETLLHLISLWNDLEHNEYGHGYLILAISGFLILRDRKALSALTPCPSYPALLAILVASLLWMSVTLVSVLDLQPFSLLLLILAVVWAILGNQVTSKLLFPILFISFALPIWFPLSPIMQGLSADAVFLLIRSLGVPAFLDNHDIVLPSGALTIAAGCNGMRYLIPGMALGVLYGHLNYTSFRAKLIVFLVSASASILANILRIFIVVYLAYKTDMQHPFIKDHLALGWYLFGAMEITLLGIDALLNRRYQLSEYNIASLHNNLVGKCKKGNLQCMSIFVASLLLLSSGPAATYWINQHSFIGNMQTELRFPSGIGGWNGPYDSDNDWMPEYHGAIARKQSYQKDNQRIDLYVGYYMKQSQGKELIYYLNQIANQDIWHSYNPEGNSKQTSKHTILEQVLQKNGGEQRLVWYWYRVAGRPMVNPYQAKALQVLGLLIGKPQAQIIAISVESNGDINNARNILDEFISVMDIPIAKLVNN